MLNLLPIGYVKSSVKEPVDEHWSNVVSEIHILEKFASGLQGLKKFSHLIVIFWMHRASFDPSADLVRRPRGRMDMPQVGIFAQRAKHRPNPIGISAVKLLGIEGGVVKVRGLDAIDNTPVMDIKPYVPIFDRVDRAIVPDWMQRLMRGYF